MDIFLVPIGANRYELYSEQDATPVSNGPTDGARRSWWQRQIDRFQAMLSEAEAERIRAERGEASQKRGVGRWVMGRIADAIVEQRLLWQLRHLDAARLSHPDDLDGARAVGLARDQMRQDYAKHRRWCIIDAIIASITGPLFFFVPGPNVISWYFAFRALGHFFALRGARKGLNGIDWQRQASPDLAAVRQALGLSPDQRAARLSELGAALGLARLATFISRAASRPS